MALTLLAMVQAVADEISLTRPSSLFANTDTGARQMLALANREGMEQSSAFEWPQLRLEYLLTTVSGQESYPFPTDFSRMIPDTEWDRGARWPLNGPLDAQEWQTIKSGFGNVGPRTRYRIMQGQIYLDPIPSTTTTTIAFEYVSTSWCKSAAAVGQASWMADSDTFVLDEQVFMDGLKWRFLRAKGLDYAREEQLWMRALDRAKARAGSAPVLSLSVGSFGFGNRFLDAGNVPDTGFGP